MVVIVAWIGQKANLRENYATSEHSLHFDYIFGVYHIKFDHFLCGEFSIQCVNSVVIYSK